MNIIYPDLIKEQISLLYIHLHLYVHIINSNTTKNILITNNINSHCLLMKDFQENILKSVLESIQIVCQLPNRNH